MAESNGRRKIEFPWQSGGQGRAGTTQSDTDPWGRSIDEQASLQESAIPDPNAIMASVMPVAARRKKRNRGWEKKQNVVRYRGVTSELREAVKEVAQNYEVPSDEVARAFLEYGLSLHHQGQIDLTPKLSNGRMSLYPSDQLWTDHRAWGKGNGKVSPCPKKKNTKKKKGDTSRWQEAVTYRLPLELHNAIRSLAEQLNVPIGDLVTKFFGRALQDLEVSDLLLNPQPVTSRKTLFPEVS